MQETINFEIISLKDLFNHASSDDLLSMMQFPEQIHPVVLCGKTVFMRGGILIPFAEVERIIKKTFPPVLAIPYDKFKAMNEELQVLLAYGVVSDNSVEELDIRELDTQSAMYAVLEPDASVEFTEYLDSNVSYTVKNITKDTTLNILIYADQVIIHGYNKQQEWFAVQHDDMQNKVSLHMHTKNCAYEHALSESV